MSQNDYQNQNEYQRIESTTRITLRPLASPVPLGFFAFGAGSFLLSALQLGFLPAEEARSVALILGAFAFPAEGLAAIFAFLARETLGATVLGLFSFAWLATSIVTYTAAQEATSGALGMFEAILAVILVLIGVTAFLGKPLLGVVIMQASVRYGLNAAFELSGTIAVQTASGYLGLLIALVSLYGGIAFGLEDLKHRAVLPLGRRGEALQAFQGDLGEQVGPVESEAGVRKQL